jgi:hypothetical protein
MFQKIYGEDVKKLFHYLKKPFPFSDTMSFAQTMMLCKNQDTCLEHLLGVQILSSYGNWIHKQKKEHILNKTPPYLKFDYLKTHFNNLFVSQSKKDDLFELFCSVQKHYMVLSRFAYLCKWKRAPFAVETDLYLNTIEKDKTHTFTLYQNNTKYLFNVPQLIRVIETDLFHEWEGCFCVHVKCPKNPYNKLQLNKVHFYNLYFHYKYKMNVNPPQFLYLMFLEDFCLSRFSRNNDCFLRKLCIKNYTKTVPNTSKHAHDDVLDMLDEYSYSCKWAIDSDFPRDILIDVMRPYLYVYYLITYDALSEKQCGHYEITLSNALFRFYKKNRKFGRKIFVPAKNNVFPPSEFSRKFFKQQSKEKEKEKEPKEEKEPNEEKKKEIYNVQFNTEGHPFASWAM